MWNAYDGTGDTIPEIVLEHLDDMNPVCPVGLQIGDPLNWEAAARMIMWDLAGRP
jgi:hypothetical protein